MSEHETETAPFDEDVRALRAIFDSPAAAAPADDAAAGRVWDEIARRIGDEPVPAVASGPSARRWSRLAGAAAAVVVVGAVATGLGWPAPAGATVPPMLEFGGLGSAAELAGAPGSNATAVLLELAERAESRAVDGQGPVEVIRSEDWSLSTDTADPGSAVVHPTRTTVWVTAQLDTWVMHEQATPLDADGRGIDVGSPVVLRADEIVEGGPAVATEDLPREPAELALAMAEWYGCGFSTDSDPAQCLVHAVTSLHRSRAVPADLDAALWRVLARTPGIVSFGSVTDRAGRQGIAVGADVDNAATIGPTRQVMLIDATDGRLLGAEWILVGPSSVVEVEPPAVVGFTTFAPATWLTELPHDVG